MITRTLELALTPACALVSVAVATYMRLSPLESDPVVARMLDQLDQLERTA